VKTGFRLNRSRPGLFVLIVLAVVARTPAWVVLASTCLALASCDGASTYALTGAIFSRDRQAAVKMADALRHTAGNFYINDKPTGAVVGQQPFGGSRASGTNDKAGSAQNLQRWVTPRTIKELFVSPRHFGYPFLAEDEE